MLAGVNARRIGRKQKGEDDIVQNALHDCKITNCSLRGKNRTIVCPSSGDGETNQSGHALRLASLCSVVMIPRPFGARTDFESFTIGILQFLPIFIRLDTNGRPVFERY